MQKELTWGEVLNTFAGIIQQHDTKNKCFSELTCRKLFAEAMPAEWLSEQHLRVSPKKLLMNYGPGRRDTADGATVVGSSIAIAFADGHPLYLESFGSIQTTKKTTTATDTILIQKQRGIWTPVDQSGSLKRSFYDDVRGAERELAAIYYKAFFKPAIRLSELAKEIGEDKVAEVYDTMNSIIGFTPHSAKPLCAKEILSLANVRTKDVMAYIAANSIAGGDTT